MLNTIFKKQFFFFFGILILSFSLLGLALTLAFSQYFQSKTSDELRERGLSISAIYEQAYIDANDKNLKLSDINEVAQLQLVSIEKFLKISFILTDETFLLLDCSDEIVIEPTLPMRLPIMDLVLRGEVAYVQSDLNAIFSEEVLTVACPIIFDGEVKGAILMISTIPEIQKSVSEISRVTLVAIVISVGVAFLLIYISSKSISTPLYEMNEGAKIIASGDFEKRIEIKSKDEVGQLAESFNMMAESLQEQEIQRKNFVSNISHDLRSPLTSMHGFLTAILDGTIPEQRQERYLKIILEETDRLSKLANDILDINKVEIIELNLTIFDINEVIKKTVIQFEKRILDKNINMKVVFENEVNTVYADFEKVQRILHNLLDNAIKFTENDGNIKVETYLRDSKILISVKDDGRGILKENQRNVFERFFKEDESRGMDKKGSGLGLSIIKEFVKAHNETITVKSKEGEGAEFIFTLKPVEIGDGSII